MTEYVTKDSGERATFESGMQRDTQAGKPRFDLMLAEGVPYDEQMITRFAKLLGRGAEKYDDRNWEKADSEAELARMKSSAFRHFMQWMCGETDEDHAAGTIFNILAFETTSYKVDQDKDGSVKFGPFDPQLPEEWREAGYVSEDGFDAPARPVVGASYGPPPQGPTPFVHPDDKVKDPGTTLQEVIAEYVGMGYSQEEARKIYTERFAPKPDQVREQVQARFNGGITFHEDVDQIRLARHIRNAMDEAATQRLRQRRSGY